jgi:hypothetical protein
MLRRRVMIDVLYICGLSSVHDLIAGVGGFMAKFCSTTQDF